MASLHSPEQWQIAETRGSSAGGAVASIQLTSTIVDDEVQGARLP
jgi:hypothetical protein